MMTILFHPKRRIIETFQACHYFRRKYVEYYGEIKHDNNYFSFLFLNGLIIIHFLIIIEKLSSKEILKEFEN